VWCHHGNANRHIGIGPGKNQCNAAAIAVANQQWSINAQRGNQRRQHFFCLAMHVARRAWRNVGFRAAIAGP
jgi:hypothetical protein